MSDQILSHLIDIKGSVGGINQHLKTLNGSVAKQQKQINVNTKDITTLKVWAAKWTGGIVVLITLMNIFIPKIF